MTHRRPIDASHVCSPAAYVLFYSRDASRPTYCAAAASAMQTHAVPHSRNPYDDDDDDDLP